MTGTENRLAILQEGTDIAVNGPCWQLLWLYIPREDAEPGKVGRSTCHSRACVHSSFKKRMASCVYQQRNEYAKHDLSTHGNIIELPRDGAHIRTHNRDDP